MSDSTQDSHPWAKLLNPVELRRNLIAASLYLAAYETLCTSIIDRIHRFFSDDFRDGNWIASEEYKTECQTLSKKRLTASLLWLKRMAAIDDSDIALMDRLRKHRNELAHQLPTFLSDRNAEIDAKMITEIHRLVTKIDRWWIREVDMTIDPAFDGKSVPDSEITSGNTLFIQLMQYVATDENSAAFWEEFQKLARTPT